MYDNKGKKGIVLFHVDGSVVDEISTNPNTGYDATSDLQVFLNDRGWKSKLKYDQTIYIRFKEL